MNLKVGFFLPNSQLDVDVVVVADRRTTVEADLSLPLQP